MYSLQVAVAPAILRPWQDHLFIHRSCLSFSSLTNHINYKRIILPFDRADIYSVLGRDETQQLTHDFAFHFPLLLYLMSMT